MPTFVDGKLLRDNIKAELLGYTKSLPRPLSFHIIYLGADPVIDTFIRYKSAFGKDLGTDVVVHRLASGVSFQDVQDLIADVESKADGIIIQLPLPDHLDRQAVLDLVPPEKDVDVLSTAARQAFRDGKTNLMPPVTSAIAEVVDHYDVNLTDKNIVLVGMGSLVGYPTSLWLDRQQYSYQAITNETLGDEKAHLLGQADVVISGVGVPHLLTADMVKEGVVLIDAGTSEEGRRILGDIHPDTLEKGSIVTPVPGGIGPITIAALYRNLVLAHQNR